jgi:hypothetical protein
MTIYVCHLFVASQLHETLTQIYNSYMSKWFLHLEVVFMFIASFHIWHRIIIWPNFQMETTWKCAQFK